MRFSLCTVVAAVAMSSITFAVSDEMPKQATRLAEEGHKHEHGGEKHKLGRQKIGTFNVSLNIVGEPKAGEEVVADIKLIDAKADPKALRVWIGTEDAKGSEKGVGEKLKTTYDVHVKIPSPMPAGSKIWVEIETEEGVVKGSFGLPEKHNH